MSRQLSTVTDRDVRRSDSSPPLSGGFHAKVVTVHDGDTCDLVIVKNGGFERFKSRLLGTNSAELGSGNLALKSRDFLAWLCIGRPAASFPRSSPPWTETQLQSYLNGNQVLVYAEFQGTGGYGRPLVTLRSQPGAAKSINSVMIDNGYAKIY